MRTDDTIVISSQFNGPPNSGNGGVCAGLAAQFINGQAEVRLSAPPPLDTPISVVRDKETVRFEHDGHTVMSAKPGLTPSTPPAPPPVDVIRATPVNYPTESEHGIPGCFVCGPRRGEGDGLCVHAQPIPGHSGASCLWTPHKAFSDENGDIKDEFVWGALDCPSAFALNTIEPVMVLLGTMRGKILRAPKANEEVIVTAWGGVSEGRKHPAGTAIYAPNGDLLAHADTLWIELKNTPDYS